jgi:hypothetical protein
MAYKIDISNVAYSPEYIDYRNAKINDTYHQKYKIDEKILDKGNIKIISEYYKNTSLEVKGYRIPGCINNKIYRNEILLHEYINIYDDKFLCEYIKYNNGLDYLIYREDLYGYSVCEIGTKNTFEYFPKCSFVEPFSETFIGTNIHYNVNNNIFAVEGCYWACPFDVFLIKTNNIMEQFIGLLNIHYIIEKKKKKYDEISFVKWENNDIILKCYNIETEPHKDEILILKEKEYMDKIIIVK